MRAQLRSSGDNQPLTWPAYIISAVLAVSILFGGGGAEAPFNDGLILGLSALLLVSLLAAHWFGARPLPMSAIVPVLLVDAFLLIGVFQLFPVQFDFWRAQPGRDVAGSILHLVGADAGSRPLSLDPDATRRAMAAMLLPAAMMIAALASSRREITLILRTVIACALISSLIGMFQVALGYPSWLNFYDAGAGDSSQVLANGAPGVFANVNHQATLLLTAMVCVGLSIRLNRGSTAHRHYRAARRGYVPWLLIPLFMVMTVATGSRAAFLLLFVAVPVSAMIGLGRTSARFLVLVVLVVGLAAIGLSEITPAGNSLSLGQSYVFGNDKRYAILPDVLITLKQFWPLGSGFGTFVPVFAVNENLDIAGFAFVNHAHNDVLELMIEAGFAGLLWVAAAVLAICVRLVLIQLRGVGRSTQLPLAWSGFFILALIGLHSLVDFPARMPAIAAVAGIAVGLVFHAGEAERHVAEKKMRGGVIAVTAIAGLLLGGEVVRIYAAQSAVRHDRGSAAVRLDSSNGPGAALAAEEELIAGHNAAARTLATEALRDSPVLVRAVRILAVVDDLEHRNSMSAWRLASSLGWRDPATQLWAMRQALANGEFATAAIRADALLRTSPDSTADRVGMIRALAAYPPFREQLLQRLRLGPQWADAFFAVPANATDQQLAGMAATLVDLAHSGEQVTPRQARSTIQALIDRQQYSPAVALDAIVYRGDNNDSGLSLDFDQNADHYVFDVTPFEWNFVDGSGIDISVEQSGTRRVLTLGTDGRHNYLAVRRYIALGAGDYRLAYAMEGPADSPSALGVAVYCAGSRAPLATSSPDTLQGSEFVSRELRFTVPSSCPVVLLAIRAQQAEAPTEAEFSDFSLNRV